jgi:hypothetical protein
MSRHLQPTRRDQRFDTSLPRPPAINASIVVVVSSEKELQRPLMTTDDEEIAPMFELQLPGSPALAPKICPVASHLSQRVRVRVIIVMFSKPPIVLFLPNAKHNNCVIDRDLSYKIS